MINLWRFHKSRSSFGLHAKNGTKIIQTDTLWHAIWPFPNLQCCQKLSWGNIRSINSPFKNIRAAYYQTTKNQNLKTIDIILTIKSNFIAFLGILDNSIQNNFWPYFSVNKEFHPVNSSKSRPCLINQQWEAEVSHKEKVVWKWRVGHRIVFHCAEINWKRWGVVKRRLMGKIYYSSLWWKNWRPL